MATEGPSREGAEQRQPAKTTPVERVTSDAGNDVLPGVGRERLSAPHSAAALLRLQRTLGNAGVTALLQKRASSEVDDEPGGQQPASSVLDVVGRGAGQPLTPNVQADMERRLGDDFSDVRIHTDANASASAASVSAQAYTVGHEIVFGSGAFAPESPTGQHTLAHELVHVQQQRRGPVPGTDTGDGVSVSDPSDAFEQAAETQATRALAPSAPTAPIDAPAQAESSLARLGEVASAQVARSVQRVHVDLPGVEENILQGYDQSNVATTDLEPHKYSTGAHYDITRAAGTANVEVKVKFVQPDGTAIPTGDPRRTFADDVTTQLVGHWNDRFSLTNEPQGGVAPPAPTPAADDAMSAGGIPGPPPPTPVTLNVVFKATPIFDATADNSMALVHLHPPSVTADATPGKRIDAGNWFMSKGAAYPAPQDIIAAHEYGHLIGIPDEYSQSNVNMHTLLHQASPGGTQDADKQLEQAGTKAMVLAALQPALRTQVDAAVGQITTQVQGSQALFNTSLASALREAWVGEDFRAAVANVLTASATAAGKPELATGAVDDLLTAANSAAAGTVAASATTSVLNAAMIKGILEFVLGQVIASASHVELPIKDASGTESTMSVNVNVSQDVNTAATGPSAILGDAATLAQGAIGSPGAAELGPGAMPDLAPAGNLLAVIGALPAQWAAVSGLLSPTVDGMRTAMLTALSAAPFSVAAFADHAALALFEPTLLTNLAGPAASQTLIDFLSGAFKPAFQQQVDVIAGLVQSDVEAQAAGKTLPDISQNAAASDPRVAASVENVTKAIEALQKPGAAVPAAQITGAAAAPTTENVSYTVASMMGDNNAGMTVRPDYLQPVADSFNKNNKLPGEANFSPKAGVGAGPGDYPTTDGPIPDGGTAVG